MKGWRTFGMTMAAVIAAILFLPLNANAAGYVEINETNFPDEDFRIQISEEIDTDGDGKLSQTEIEAVKTLGVEGIRDLKGIEFFTELTELNCIYGYLTKLDVSQNTKLKTLSCNHNDLVELNVTGCTELKELLCYNNDLETLDLSTNTNLSVLACANNKLTKLNVSKCKKITAMECGNNQLTSLNLSGIDKIQYLSCFKNPLKTLNVSNMPDLYDLKCEKCQLTELDVSNNPRLDFLECWGNSIKELDIHNSSSLVTAYASEYNEVTETADYIEYFFDATDNLEFDGPIEYYLIVSKDTVVIDSKPAVKTPPANTAVYAGEKATFKVSAKGNGLKYQWQYKKPGDTSWTEVSAAAGKKATYSFTTAARHNGYTYRCKVMNLAGYVYSKSAKLTVKTPLKIVTQPTSVTVIGEGTKASVTVKAQGDGLTYTWYVSDPGDTKYYKSSITKDTYSVALTPIKNGRKAYCIVGDKYGGTVKTKTVTLDYVTAKPKITEPPKSIKRKVGATAKFTVTAEEGKTYQWYYKKPGDTSWTAVAAASGKTATLTFTAAARHNGYQYRCKVTNPVGSTYSKAATLTVVS